MVSLVKHARDHAKVVEEQGTGKQIKRHFIIAVGLSTVFGLGWGFGLAATSSPAKELTFTLQLLFSVFVGSQGVLIFVLHGVRSQEARNLWKSWFTTLSNKSGFSSTLNSPTGRGNSAQMFTFSRDMTLGKETNGTLQKHVESAVHSEVYRESQFREDGNTMIKYPGKKEEPGFEKKQPPY